MNKNHTPTHSPLATRYASALVELAQADKQLAEIRTACQSLIGALTPEVESMLRQPNLKSEALHKAFTKILQSAPQLVQNFVSTIINNGRTADLVDILQAVPTAADAAEGIVNATVTSTTALSAAEKKELEKALQALRPEAKSIQLATQTDATLLGGMVVQVGSTRLDASVRGQLNQFKQTLTV